MSHAVFGPVPAGLGQQIFGGRAVPGSGQPPNGRTRKHNINTPLFDSPSPSWMRSPVPELGGMRRSRPTAGRNRPGFQPAWGAWAPARPRYPMSNPRRFLLLLPLVLPPRHACPLPIRPLRLALPFVPLPARDEPGPRAPSLTSQTDRDFRCCRAVGSRPRGGHASTTSTPPFSLSFLDAFTRTRARGHTGEPADGRQMAWSAWAPARPCSLLCSAHAASSSCHPWSRLLRALASSQSALSV